MSYKTILVHCNDPRRIRNLLAPTIDLAEQFKAHLIGLSVVPPIAILSPGAPSGMPIVIDEHCKLYREENPILKAAFDEASRGRAFVTEWRDDEADAFGVSDRILRYGRAADLIVASQTDPAWASTESLDVADRLVIESGRPVLVVPNQGTHERVGDTVMIAWNNWRESARAIFDSLPILQRAREVKVVWVNTQSEQDLTQNMPSDDICAALARHGVMCMAAEETKPGLSIGETLLSCAKEGGADLLVMGCYGHSRLREFVFGGASRHVLENMTIPVLMSH